MLNNGEGIKNQKIDQTKIVVAQNSSCMTTTSGTLTLRVVGFPEGEHMVLDRVFVIPEFNKRIISLKQLTRQGFKLGFKNRAKEIVRIVKATNADLLVIGAHGHRGLKDWLYGATIDSVRHQLKIPVLIVTPKV